MGVFIANFIALLASAALFILGAVRLDQGGLATKDLVMVIVTGLYLFLVGPVLFGGFRILKPREALVLTLFGKYHGSLREAGFYFINPFATAVRPIGSKDQAAAASPEKSGTGRATTGATGNRTVGKTVSLKAMTLSNDKQKVNDALGNPIIIGIVVIWKVINPTKAVLDVDDYPEYLSIQCDSALRNIVRLYPYDSADDEEEKSLRGSSQEVARKLKEEIQEKVAVAGIEIVEARITHLSYAPEIAAAMLQRQQASAIIAAKQKIVEGAVGMVEMALAKLSDNKIVDLDEERKAAMVSNLLVVLCSNKDIQPVVNSGSIY
ncbi:MAG: SPFH domain-containing protein [Spirochaetota bacterium]